MSERQTFQDLTSNYQKVVAVTLFLLGFTALFNVSVLVAMQILAFIPYVLVCVIAAIVCVFYFYKYYSWLKTNPEGGKAQHVVYMYLFACPVVALLYIAALWLGVSSVLSLGATLLSLLLLLAMTFNPAMTYLAIPALKHLLELYTK